MSTNREVVVFKPESNGTSNEHTHNDNNVLKLARCISQTENAHNTALNNLFKLFKDMSKEQFEDAWNSIKKDHKNKGLPLGQSLKNLGSSMRNAFKEGVKLEEVETQNAMNAVARKKTKERREKVREAIKDSFDELVSEIKVNMKRLNAEQRARVQPIADKLNKAILAELASADATTVTSDRNI